MNTDSNKPSETSAATAPRPTSKPAVRAPSSVADILARWPLKKHDYTLNPALTKYCLVLISILLVIVITTTVLFISAGDVFFDFNFDFSRPSSQGGGGGVANLDGNRPFADGASGTALLPWADNITIIPSESIKSSYVALADLSTGEIIASCKADEVIYPDIDIAERLAMKISSSIIHDYFELSDDYAVFELEVPDTWRGSDVMSINPRQKYDMNLLLIRKPNGSIFPPTAKYVFEVGDHMMVFGNTQNTIAFTKGKKKK